MKKKYYIWLGLAGVVIVALLVTLIVLLNSGGRREEQGGGGVSDFVLPNDGNYSKYESSYDEMYKLVEYAKNHPEEVELNQYVEGYLDKIESMAGVLPIYSTSSEDSYDFYSITNGSSRTECPVFCIYIEASTPYMYDLALAELKKVSKYPLEEYMILKKVLYYPIGEPEPGY